jgi:anti-sigma B factor antagonist
VETHSSGVEVRLTLPHRVDAATIGAVRYELEIAVAAGSGDLILDCSGVQVLDSAGLALLVGTHRRCRQAGRRLVLSDPQPNVLRLLAVTRLHRVLHLDRATRSVG